MTQYLAIIAAATDAGHLQVDTSISMRTGNDLNPLKVTCQYDYVTTSSIRLHAAHHSITLQQDTDGCIHRFP